jgi:hypothetical protein
MPDVLTTAGRLPSRNGASWTSPLTLTGFLEPGAHLMRYPVDPGSRNHGSELPYDGGDRRVGPRGYPLGPPTDSGRAQLRQPARRITDSLHG